MRCAEHGVRTIGLPWSDPGSRFMALFEALVIDWLGAASMSAVARLLDLSWDQVDGVMQRAVKHGLERRGPAPASRRLGVDETSFQKRHEYVTVVADIEGEPRVHHVADGRGKDALSSYYESLSEAERCQIETVAMDMWPAYISATVSCLPDGGDKIAYDKFHVAAHLGDAVDEVRREEHRQLRSLDDERLTDTRYLWRYHPDRVPERSWARFKELIDGTSKTARCWHPKEMAMMMWETSDRTEALAVFKGWYSWAIRSRLEPMKRVARMNQGPSRRRAERHRARRHQRTPRRHQHGDPVAQEIRSRLSKSGPLPHRHLLPSRRTRPLPRYTHVPLETLKSPCL